MWSIRVQSINLFSKTPRVVRESNILAVADPDLELRGEPVFF